MSGIYLEGQLGEDALSSAARVGCVVNAAATVAPFFLSLLAQLRLSSTPALVAHAQGGLALGPEQGELAADFSVLGTRP
jgi:hypothetical protein